MTLPADINDFLDPILRTFENQLTTNVQGHLVTGYLKGSAEMLEWGRTKVSDMPIFYEGPPMRQAMDYAQKHTATLVKGINDETREQMRHVITQAVKDKRGIPGLSRDLRRQISGMGKVRAKVIARTETCDALESAFMDRAKDMKVTGKEWIVTDPCEICEENGNVGPILIDKSFPSGHMRPPAHPNCRCALAPVMLTAKGERPGPGIIQKAEQAFGAKYGNTPIEYGRGIDDLGRTILTKKGTATQVKYTAQDVGKLANAKSFIHNHPGDITTTFSADDIMFAKKINAGRVVAVGQSHKFTASPVKTWAETGDFGAIYKKLVAQAHDIITAQYRTGRLSLDAANAKFRERLHNIMTELAPKYGIKYGRELI